MHLQFKCDVYMEDLRSTSAEATSIKLLEEVNGAGINNGSDLEGIPNSNGPASDSTNHRVRVD